VLFYAFSKLFNKPNKSNCFEFVFATVQIAIKFCEKYLEATVHFKAHKTNTSMWCS